MPLTASALFLSCTARAAQPTVVFSGTPAEALSAAVARGKGAPGAIDALPIEALRARPPWLTGPGAAWSCASESEPPTSTSIALARKSIGHAELDAASSALDNALDALVCEPFAPTVAWTVWFLRGIVATYRNDELEARSSFRNARIASPSQPWDDTYADGELWFDEALAEEPSIRLSLVPSPASWSVDGSSIDGVANLSEGSHLLELGQQPPVTIRVDLAGRGATTLILPSLLPETLLRWPQEPERWHDLSLVLASLPQSSTGIGLYAAPDLFWADAPEGPYTHLPQPLAAPDRARLPRWTLGLGATGVLGAATAVGCTVAAESKRREAKSLEDSPYPLYALAQDAYHRLDRCAVAADAVAIVSFGASLAGVVQWRLSR